MNTNEYVIGDRVECIVDYPDGNGRIEVGATGTVCCVDEDFVGVEWDEWVDGHQCNRCCKIGHGWNVSTKEIRHASSSEFDSDESAFRLLYSEFKIHVDEEK